MTPSGINKPLHLFIYIGGAVVVDKIISKTNPMQISFCFPVSCFLLSCCLHAARNTERSGYCGENADRNLNHHFPSILLHCFNVYFLIPLGVPADLQSAVKKRPNLF